MNIYVHKEGTQYGPYTLEQLQQYIQQGSFTLQDQACFDGQNWLTVAQVPGISQAATDPVQPQPASQSTQPGQQKRTQVRKKQTASKNTETSANKQAQVKKNRKGSKVLIIAGGLGTLLIVLVAVICYIVFSGEDNAEEKGKLVADDKNTEKSNSSTSNLSSTEERSAPPSVAVSDISLFERIPSDSGAIILVRVHDLLDKGRDDIKALLPPGLPPMAGKALEDPASLGIDVAEPFQIHLIPQENTDLAPTGGLAVKLSDKEKFMNTIELLAGLDPPVQKDGYLLYAPLGNSEPQIAVGSDFFFAGFADKSAEREPSIDKFMTADGSNSLTKSNESFSRFTKENHDLSIWFGGDSILETLSNQMDNANFDTMKGGSGTISLNFEDGEFVAQIKVDAPNNEMVYGKGGFSDGILKFAPTDAILALGFAFDLSKFVEFAEKEIIPEFGDDIKLDDPMPELGGLSLRDAISAFKGEFLVSLTDVKMPSPGAGGGFPGGDANPFGDPDMEGDANPFGDPEMAQGDIPFPAPGGASGFPSGGPPPGGMDPSAMMMAAMPKPEFIVAASIDTERWLKLKAAPPLAMGMGLAMMQGYSITEKDGFLLIASKDHLQATQTGSVKNPASGPGRDLFANNDFVLKINVAPILKMDLPIPPGGPMEMLKEISHLEMASNSAKNSGTGTFRLVLTDKGENSLSLILQMVKGVMTMEQGEMNVPNF
jgi:hypothetical protein